MSSDNASYAVTYTSIYSDSNGLSCGIPLVMPSGFQESDPYRNEPEDDYEDPEEDPKEEHTDYPADGEDRDEPSDDDDDDDDTCDEDEEPTKDRSRRRTHSSDDSSQYLLLTLLPSAVENRGI
ncbi:hypothetical protein Tco_0451408 [Tanacetum coccineum]